MMQDVYSVGSLRWFPIVHHVGHEVVGGVLLRGLALLRQVLPQVYVSSGGKGGVKGTLEVWASTR